MTDKLTKEDMTKWLLNDGRGIKIIGEYINSGTKTLFECPMRHQWQASPNNVKSGRGCPRCSGKHQPTTEEFRQRLAEDGRGIKMLGEYINSSTKTLFECSHGHQFLKTPSGILQNGCLECRTTKHTTDDFNEWLSLNSDVTLIGEYLGSRTKTKFRCIVGHEWDNEPSGIKQGSGCPYCAIYGFKTDKPAWEYAFTRNGYLKCGITNDLTRRLNEHRKHGEIVLVHERYHEIGQLALNWENNIKRTHGGRHVTKEECPDGYTETFPLHLLETIIK